MHQHSDQRIGIFVDIQNLYHSAKHLYKARVNFAQLIKHLTGSRKLVRVIGYVVQSETSPGEASFFDALEKTGIELRIKDLQIFGDGSKKADWDVGMAVDAMRLASSLDVVVLVTGDGDFVPLVDYLIWGLGKRVEAASFSKSTSARLKEAVDTFTGIDDIPKILIKTPRPRFINQKTV